jgi:hypothetical protein
LPKTLLGYIWKASARHQLGLCLLSVTVFLLSAVPLELQRRIVNDAIGKGALGTILWLALAYAALALTEGGVKLWLNVYRSWVSERAVRHLRHAIGAMTQRALAADDRAKAEGVEISMMLSESEPIGGFVGVSISEPLLQGGILLSVFGYLAWLEPWMALLLTLIHFVISARTFNSSKSRVPRAGRGKFSIRLPLRLTMSASMSIMVFGVLYCCPRM